MPCRTSSWRGKTVDVALSTMWWGETDQPVDGPVRRTAALGFRQIELDYRRPPQTLAELRQALSQAGIEAVSMHAPFPCPPGAAPLQQADLAAEDEPAWRHALELVEGTLAAAAEWGIHAVVLHCGDMPALAELEGRLKRLVQAGRSAGAESARLRRELQQRRAEEAPRHLERVRRALAELAPRAAELGIVIGLETRASYRDLPGLGEVGQLLDDFAPAASYWHDVGHAFRQEALGFAPQEEWLERYGDRLLGIHLHDVSGMADHLPPGQGEVPFDRLAPLFPAAARRVIEVQSRHSSAEVAAGLSYLQAMGVVR